VRPKIRSLTYVIVLAVVLLGCALAAFAGTHLAAHHLAGDVAGATSSDSSSFLDLLKPVYDAVTGGRYALAGALGIIALVALGKRYLGDSWKNSAGVGFLHTDLGGTLSALVAAVGTALAAALGAPGAHISFGMVESALLVGVGAAGGFAVLKNLLFEPLIAPLEKWATAKWAWTAPIFRVITWIFDKPDPVAQAETAGNAAVAANPAPGVGASAGAVTELK
jgi:hypothetical protein